MCETGNLVDGSVNGPLLTIEAQLVGYVGQIGFELAHGRLQGSQFSSLPECR